MTFRRKHEHDYEAIGVDSRKVFVMASASTDFTVILWRCRCKDVTSSEIQGRWTLAQVRGEDPNDMIVANSLIADGK
jgi:hypothetical protein